MPKVDYIASLKQDLDAGFTKAELERLIGLPQNNLSAILKGTRSLSRKSELKIDKWMQSEKPDPLGRVQEPSKKTFEEAWFDRSIPTSQVADYIEQEIPPKNNTDRIAEIQDMLTTTKSRYLSPAKKTALKNELRELTK